MNRNVLLCVSFAFLMFGFSQTIAGQTESIPATEQKEQGSENKNSDNTPQTGIDPVQDSATQGSDSKTEGSESKSEGSDNKSEDDPAYKRFVQLGQELKRNEQLLNKLVISMPVGFPEARKQQQQKINGVKQRNQQIYKELLPTALESFDNFPNSKPAINGYLIQHMSLQLTGKNWKQIPFNPLAAKRMYDKLTSAGVENPVLSLLGYRINFILNDLEQSRLLLIKAAEQGRPEQAAMDNLRKNYQSWMQEMELVKKDASNDNNPRVKIETDIGDMIVELFEDEAPNTVANFVSLVESGFYNGQTFFQANVSDIVMAGSPTNDGLGGPGYKIKCECEAENARSHFTGYLSMYPTRKDEGGSRFLITKQPRPAFGGKITAFGRIIEGLENLYKIQIFDHKRQGQNPNMTPTRITQMTVIRKREHPYVPEKVTESSTPATGN